VTVVGRRGPRVVGVAPARVFGVSFGVAPVPGWSPASAGAATGDLGSAGPSTSGDRSAATGEKPESELWWNDGSWWAVLFHTGSQTHHIFRLDRSSEQWVDTGTTVDWHADLSLDSP
jgi:hypothetical protein